MGLYKICIAYGHFLEISIIPYFFSKLGILIYLQLFWGRQAALNHIGESSLKPHLFYLFNGLDTIYSTRVQFLFSYLLYSYIFHFVNSIPFNAFLGAAIISKGSYVKPCHA